MGTSLTKTRVFHLNYSSFLSLTLFVLFASRDVVVEHGTQHRHLSNILIHATPFLAGVTPLEQAAVDGNVGALSLQAIVYGDKRSAYVSR